MKVRLACPTTFGACNTPTTRNLLNSADEHLTSLSHTGSYLLRIGGFFRAHTIIRLVAASADHQIVARDSGLER